MTDATEKLLPERIWAYKTSGSNNRHFKECPIPSCEHHTHYMNVTEYVRADIATRTPIVNAPVGDASGLLRCSHNVISSWRRGDISTGGTALLELEQALKKYQDGAE